MKLQRKNTPFTMVASEVLNRPDISLKAKGMFAYLFSKPESWDFSSKRMGIDLAESHPTIQSVLRELEKVKLLTRKRLKTGKVQYILEYSIKPESKDFTQPQVKNLHSEESLPISNIDIDSNMDHATQSVASAETKKKVERSNELIQNYNFDEYVKKMENDPRRAIQVIAFYFKKKKIRFDSLMKIQSAIKRHLRAANEVAKFSDDEIVKAYRTADREYPNLYTVETLHKVLTR